MRCERSARCVHPLEHLVILLLLLILIQPRWLELRRHALFEPDRAVQQVDRLLVQVVIVRAVDAAVQPDVGKVGEAQRAARLLRGPV